MKDKWEKLQEFIDHLAEQSYEESVWITCANILDEMKELNREEDK